MSHKKAKQERQASCPKRLPKRLESSSHRRKLACADFHIEEVEALLTGWNRKGHRTFTKPKGEGRFVLFAEQAEPLPDELTLVVGDAVQCLRNSLDHVVFALARKHTPNMTAKQERDTEFPIGDAAVAITDKRISCVSPDARKEICALAPNPAWEQLDRDPLWMLNKLSNRDKHRELLVAVGIARPTGVIIRSSIDFLQTFGIERLEAGAPPVALYEWSGSGQFDPEVGHAIEVVFDEDIERGGREVIGTLRWFHDHIRDTVFQRLEPYL